MQIQKYQNPIKNIKLSSFKGNEINQKKLGGPDSTVLNNLFSSMNLNELAMNTGEIIL